MTDLLSDVQLGYAGSVALDVLGGKIVEQISALADHFEQSAAGMIIMGMRLEMLVEDVDALGQNGDLHLGRAGIALMYAVAFDDLGLSVFQKHFSFPFQHSSAKIGNIMEQSLLY